MLGHRGTCIAGGAVIYFLICTSLSRNPKLGLLGGFLAAIAVGVWSQQLSGIHWAVQTGLAYLLIHSLRWVDSEHRGATLLRWLGALTWIAHSLAWMHLYSVGWRACGEWASAGSSWCGGEECCGGAGVL